MPVEANTVEFSYLGDGATTEFPFPARFLSASDITVGLEGQIQTSGFTVSGAGQNSGGAVTFTTAPTAGVRVSLLRSPPASQLIDFANGQTVLEGILDTGLDKLTMIVQYLLRGGTRTVRLGDFDPAPATSLVLPNAAGRAGKLIGFDMDGNLTPVTPSPAGTGTVGVGSIVGATAAGQAMLLAADAAAQRTLLGILPDGLAAFATRAAAQAATIDAAVQRLLLSGRSSVSDRGGGFYVRLSAAPVPVRAWHFSSNGGAVWWQLEAFPAVSARQLDARGDGVANDTTALQDMLDYAAAFDVRAYIPSGVYNVPTATLDIFSGVLLHGDGDTSVIRRTTNAVVPLLRAASQTNLAVRDVRLDSTAGWASASSITLAVASRVFAVQAGLDVAVNDAVQITSSTAPRNYAIGTVTAYTGTSMTVNLTTVIGAGTFSSWRFDRFNGENTALSFETCQNADAGNVVVSGRFYVGIRSLNGNGDSINECEISGTVNRPIYGYGTAGTTDGLRVINNRVRGGTYSQYGINLNGSGGAIENAVISGNVVDQTVFQGIEVGGSCSFVTVNGNQVDSVSGDGVGILVQRANGVQPTRVVVDGNTVKNVTGTGSGIFVLDCFYVTVAANTVAVCGTGIRVAQATAGVGCQYINVNANNVSNCTGDGIRFASASPSLGSSHSCTGNVCIANTGTGIVSEANTDRIAYVGNVSMANGAQYGTLGTNHATAGNI